MANLLTMALIDSIFTLHRRGWSARRIAHELGIHRETVARYLQQGPPSSKPANAPIGSDGESAESKPANAPIGSGASEPGSKPANAPIGAEGAVARIGRPSDCEPYRAIILAGLAQGLT